MRMLFDACAIVVLFLLYWGNRQRRRYLKKRVGKLAARNVYQIARNIGHMVSGTPLSVQGDRSRITPGSILFSLHFGLWELMPRTLDALGYRVGIVVNRYASGSTGVIARLADRILFRYRRVGSVLVFYRDETLKIVRFLKSGGILGILIDGDSLYAKHPLARKLSRISCAPLVPFAAYASKGRGVLHIGCDLSMIVKEHPLDYLWFYRSRSTQNTPS